jgi:hypothetical protein
VAHQIPYQQKTYRPDDDLIAGNTTASNPVEFDLAPAEGQDMARIKSILVATGGLLAADAWSAEVQRAVISAFETGAPAFNNTVEAIRGLTVPAALAKRVGMIDQVVDPSAQIPVVNGVQFGRVGMFFPVLAMQVAAEIVNLSNHANVDPRFFVQPSGSGGPATSNGTAGTADTAPQRPEGNGTAGSRRRKTASRKPGTSDPNPS